MEVEKLDLTNLFTNLALYHPLKFTDQDSRDLKRILVDQTYEFQFDCYCIECEKDSTFKTKDIVRGYNPLGPGSAPLTPAEITNQLKKLSSSAFIINFHCQRVKNHTYQFSYKFIDSHIVKIGQYPSIATIQTSDIKKYRNELKSDYNDFSKAIGLFSHGIGIGSFVYIRRIFENLVEEKGKEAAENSEWDSAAFENSKMENKIKLLSDKLPPILVENKKLYGIVSKGIHELSEKDCLDLFPDVQLAIELILDEKIYLNEQKQKANKVRSFISNTAAHLKK